MCSCQSMDECAGGIECQLIIAKVAKDISTILREAEKHGTLGRLPEVGIHFSEAELRAIHNSLIK